MLNDLPIIYCASNLIHLPWSGIKPGEYGCLRTGKQLRASLLSMRALWLWSKQTADEPKVEEAHWTFPKIPFEVTFGFWGFQLKSRAEKQSVEGGVYEDCSGYQPLGCYVLKCKTTCRVTWLPAGKTCALNGQSKSQVLWSDDWLRWTQHESSLMALLSFVSSQHQRPYRVFGAE